MSCCGLIDVCTPQRHLQRMASTGQKSIHLAEEKRDSCCQVSMSHSSLLFAIGVPNIIMFTCTYARSQVGCGPQFVVSHSLPPPTSSLMVAPAYGLSVSFSPPHAPCQYGLVCVAVTTLYGACFWRSFHHWPGYSFLCSSRSVPLMFSIMSLFLAMLRKKYTFAPVQGQGTLVPPWHSVHTNQGTTPALAASPLRSVPVYSSAPPVFVLWHCRCAGWTCCKVRSNRATAGH